MAKPIDELRDAFEAWSQDQWMVSERNADPDPAKREAVDAAVERIESLLTLATRACHHATTTSHESCAGQRPCPVHEFLKAMGDPPA